MKIGATEKNGKVYVTNHELNLLGIDWIEEFGLWDKPFNSICNTIQINTEQLQNAIITKFPAVFTKKLGKCTKLKVKIHLKQGAVPVFVPKRRPAIAVLVRVEEELRVSRWGKKHKERERRGGWVADGCESENTREASLSSWRIRKI